MDKKYDSLIIGMRKKNRQHGSVYVIILIFIAAVAIWLSGIFTNGTNNGKTDDSLLWVYFLFPTQQSLQSQKTIQEHTISFMSIPRKVLTQTGPKGTGIHSLGNIPSKIKIPPSVYLQNHSAQVPRNMFQKLILPFIQSFSVYAFPNSAGRLSPFLPPVGDQGKINACSAWSTGYALLGTYANKGDYYPTGGPPLDGETVGGFAPMYLYTRTNIFNNSSMAQQVANYCKDSKNQPTDDCGSLVSDNIKLMIADGTDTRQDYTQGDNDYKHPPTSQEQANAANYKALAMQTLFSGGIGQNAITLEQEQTAVKLAIAGGSGVIIGFYVYPSFDLAMCTPLNPTKCFIDSTSGNQIGAHAVMAYAYDTNGLWIQNQWGTNWGLHGNAEISWNYFNRTVFEAYTITPPTVNVNVPTPVCTHGQNQCGNCPADGTACSPDTGQPNGTPFCLDNNPVCTGKTPTFTVHECVNGKYRQYPQSGWPPPCGPENCYPANPC